MLLEEAIKKIQTLELENENLKLENNSLKRIIFGSKREYTPKATEEQIKEQCSLFDNPEEMEKNVQEQINEQVEEITVYKKKKRKTKKAGIRKTKDSCFLCFILLPPIPSTVPAVGHCVLETKCKTAGRKNLRI